MFENSPMLSAAPLQGVAASQLVRGMALATLILACGCNNEELLGDFWNVTVSGAENLCTGGGTGYSENFEYRLLTEVTAVSLWIGEDNWANGILDGCTVHYDSIAWSDYREGYEIQWTLAGDGLVNVGGQAAGCVEGVDWEGTEVFTVTNSAHPSVQAGCTYTLDVVGTWTHAVEAQ